MRTKKRKNFNYLLKGNGRHRKNPTMKLLDKIDKVVEQDELKKQVVNSEVVYIDPQAPVYIDPQAEETISNDFSDMLKNIPLTVNEEMKQIDTEESQDSSEELNLDDMTNEEKLIFAALEGVEILELLSQVQKKYQKIKDIIEDSSDMVSTTYSEYDQEINDIYHAIELYNFNASEGYKFSKMLQETLQRRRTLKSAQSVNALVKRIFKEDNTLSSISHSAIQGYENLNKPKSYTPRKLTSLGEYVEKNKKTVLSQLQK